MEANSQELMSIWKLYKGWFSGKSILEGVTAFKAGKFQEAAAKFEDARDGFQEKKNPKEYQTIDAWKVLAEQKAGGEQKHLPGKHDQQTHGKKVGLSRAFTLETRTLNDEWGIYSGSKAIMLSDIARRLHQWNVYPNADEDDILDVLRLYKHSKNTIPIVTRDWRDDEYGYDSDTEEIEAPESYLIDLDVDKLSDYLESELGEVYKHLPGQHDQKTHATTSKNYMKQPPKAWGTARTMRGVIRNQIAQLLEGNTIKDQRTRDRLEQSIKVLDSVSMDGTGVLDEANLKRMAPAFAEAWMALTQAEGKMGGNKPPGNDAGKKRGNVSNVFTDQQVEMAVDIQQRLEKNGGSVSSSYTSEGLAKYLGVPQSRAGNLISALRSNGLINRDDTGNWKFDDAVVNSVPKNANQNNSSYRNALDPANWSKDLKTGNLRRIRKSMNLSVAKLSEQFPELAAQLKSQGIGTVTARALELKLKHLQGQHDQDDHDLPGGGSANKLESTIKNLRTAAKAHGSKKFKQSLSTALTSLESFTDDIDGDLQDDVDKLISHASQIDDFIQGRRVGNDGEGVVVPASAKNAIRQLMKEVEEIRQGFLEPEGKSYPNPIDSTEIVSTGKAYGQITSGQAHYRLGDFKQACVFCKHMTTTPGLRKDFCDVLNQTVKPEYVCDYFEPENTGVSFGWRVLGGRGGDQEHMFVQRSENKHLPGQRDQKDHAGDKGDSQWESDGFKFLETRASGKDLAYAKLAFKLYLRDQLDKPDWTELESYAKEFKLTKKREKQLWELAYEATFETGMYKDASGNKYFKHLPGQHDQSDHGRKKVGGRTPWKKVAHTPTQLRDASARQMAKDEGISVAEALRKLRTNELGEHGKLAYSLDADVANSDTINANITKTHDGRFKLDLSFNDQSDRRNIEETFSSLDGALNRARQTVIDWGGTDKDISEYDYTDKTRKLRTNELEEHGKLAYSLDADVANSDTINANITKTHDGRFKLDLSFNDQSDRRNIEETFSSLDGALNRARQTVINWGGTDKDISEHDYTDKTRRSARDIQQSRELLAAGFNRLTSYSDEPIVFNIGEKSLIEKRIKQNGDKWCVESESGKNLGCSDSKEGAARRLQQVEYFKHKKSMAAEEVVASIEDGSFVVDDFDLNLFVEKHLSGKHDQKSHGSQKFIRHSGRFVVGESEKEAFKRVFDAGRLMYNVTPDSYHTEIDDRLQKMKDDLNEGEYHYTNHMGEELFDNMGFQENLNEIVSEINSLAGHVSKAESLDFHREKHLPGRHDQDSHGKKGSRGSVILNRKDKIADKRGTYIESKWKNGRGNLEAIGFDSQRMDDMDYDAERKLRMSLAGLFRHDTANNPNSKYQKQYRWKTFDTNRNFPMARGFWTLDMHSGNEYVGLLMYDDKTDAPFVTVDWVKENSVSKSESLGLHREKRKLGWRKTRRKLTADLGDTVSSRDATKTVRVRNKIKRGDATNA